MFRILLHLAACASSFWLIGNLTIKLCGFAPEWSWWFTLSPFCATIPVGVIMASVQKHDATRAQRDFMKSFEDYQGTDRVQRHNVTRKD